MPDFFFNSWKLELREGSPESFSQEEQSGQRSTGNGLINSSGWEKSRHGIVSLSDQRKLLLKNALQRHLRPC